jgi:hypothetical protein
MRDGEKGASPVNLISPGIDPWASRMQRLDALFLGAVREALPQEEVLSVSIAYHYVDRTEVEPALQHGCVRVEIISI